jgi:cysteine synthase A
MLSSLFDSGQIDRGETVVMASSGLSALSLAAIGGAMGINVIIVATESMDDVYKEKLCSYGTEVIRVPENKGMKTAIETAKTIAFSRHEAVYINHFEDNACVEVNRDYTGVEIWQCMEENVDVLIAGVGTGASLTGVGRLLRMKNLNTRIIAVEPAESPILSGGQPGIHNIPGLGAGFIPPLYDKTLVDEIVTVRSADAIKTSAAMRKKYGLPFSVSSGAVYFAAKLIGNYKNYREKRIAALRPA